MKMSKRKHPLARALACVEKLMKHPDSVALFNEPVDVEGLGLTDYRDVVPKPMDLGTICNRLKEGEASDWKTCFYSTSDEVLADVQLVWRNCIAYNNRPDERAIAGAAVELNTLTLLAWDKAGLSTDGQPVQSGQVPKLTEKNISFQYDISLGGKVTERPLRLLDNFQIYSIDATNHITQPGLWSLEVLQQGAATLYASGRIIGQNVSEADVEVGPVLDWCVVGDCEVPYVCIVTELAWYRLLRPSHPYASLFTSINFKAQLCQCAVRALRSTPGLQLPQLLLVVCQELMERGYHVALLSNVQECLPFLRCFLTTWTADLLRQSNDPDAARKRAASAPADELVAMASQASIQALAVLERNRDASLALMRETAAILGAQAAQQAAAEVAGTATRKRKFPGAAATDDPLQVLLGMQHGVSPTDTLVVAQTAQLAGLGTQRRSGVSQSSADFDPEERRQQHLELKRQYEAERRRKKLATEAAARQHREAAAAAARAVPPPLRHDWAVPAPLVPDLLEVWDLLGSYSDALRLPPLPLARLDAALCSVSHRPNEALVKDEAGEASGLVLRDIHCALLRAVEGRAGRNAIAPDFPLEAASFANVSPCVSDDHWQLRVVKVLEPEVETLQEEPLAAEAIDALRTSDYIELPPAQRLAILRALASLAVQGDIVRDEVNRRMDDFNVIRFRGAESHESRLRRVGSAKRRSRAEGAGDEDDDGEDGGDEDEGGAPAEHLAVGCTAEEWQAYVHAARVGLRRSIGKDTLGRRYWLLGGRAGALQLFVETRPAVPDPATGEATPSKGKGAAAEEMSPEWGYYSASGIYQLVAWLKAGGVKSEAALTNAICRMPMAMPDKPAHALDWDKMEVPPAIAQLDRHHLDGYAGVLAPELPGEVASPTAPCDYPGAGLAARDALVACLVTVPFWDPSKGAAADSLLLERLVGNVSMLRAAGAEPAADVLKTVAINTETLLCAHACMEARWTASADAGDAPDGAGEGPAEAGEAPLAERWRASLAAATDLRDVVLHLAPLCAAVAWRKTPSLHRAAFARMAQFQQCPMLFPCIGDKVAVMRSGVLLHMSRFRDAILNPPVLEVDPNAADDATTSGDHGRRDDDDAAAGGGGRSGKRRGNSSRGKGGDGHSDRSRSRNNGARAAAPAAPPPATPVRCRPTPHSHATPGKSPASQRRPPAEHAASTPNGAGDAAGDVVKQEPADAAVTSEQRAVPSEAAERKPPPLTPTQLAWLKELDVVQQRAERLKPVESYVVAGIAYVPGHHATDVQRDGFVWVEQPPTMWMLLTPDLTAANNTAAREPIVLPVHMDNTLPDVIVRRVTYEQGVANTWVPGMRFRMLFGAKSSGLYYKGTITRVEARSAEGDWDPWEAFHVAWDDAEDGTSVPRVSPWEVERDPDEERLIEERRRAESAAEARAARAARGNPGAADDGGAAAEPSSSRTSSELEDAAPYNEGRAPPVGDVASPFYHLPIEPALLSAMPKDEEFRAMVTNFHAGRGNSRFKVPVFSGRDLDLHRTFFEVLALGGCFVVSQSKRWKEVCRALNVELKGQSSAAHNLRLNYDKSLREWELYIRSGGYKADEDQGTLPPRDSLYTRLQQVDRWRKGPTPVYMEFIAYPDLPEFQIKRSKSASKSDLASSADAAEAAADAAARARSGQHAAAPAEQGVDATPPSTDAAALVGHPIWRLWEGYGWYKADITEYDASTGHHKLVFQKGTESELVEQMNVLAAPVALSWRDPAAPAARPAKRRAAEKCDAGELANGHHAAERGAGDAAADTANGAHAPAPGAPAMEQPPPAPADAGQAGGQTAAAAEEGDSDAETASMDTT